METEAKNTHLVRPFADAFANTIAVANHLSEPGHRCNRDRVIVAQGSDRLGDLRDLNDVLDRKRLGDLVQYPFVLFPTAPKVPPVLRADARVGL